MDATSDTLVDLGVSSWRPCSPSGVALASSSCSRRAQQWRICGPLRCGHGHRCADAGGADRRPETQPQAVLTSFGDEAADALDDNGDVFFLTGATGFVGSFDKQLLESHPGSCCFVLVRDDDSRARLEASLHEAECADDMCARVNVVQGDLSREQFGLPDTRFVNARVVRAVFHVGAQVIGSVHT